jgi:carbon storage regulator CsrA
VTFRPDASACGLAFTRLEGRYGNCFGFVWLFTSHPVAARPVWKGVLRVLVLTRRPHEKIVLPGLGVTIEVVSTRAGGARIGIEAPPGVLVVREELLGDASQEQAVSSAVTRPKQKG